MDKIDIIKRLRERDVKWKDVAYAVGMGESAAKQALKRKKDIEELGEKPVIKRCKFKTLIVMKIKEFARDNPQMSFREYRAALVREFPNDAVPHHSTIHRMLKKI